MLNYLQDISAINYDARAYAEEYDELTAWSECGVCGIEDCCDNLIVDMDSRASTLLSKAFADYCKYLETDSIHCNFLCCVHEAFVDGHLRHREGICK